MKKRAKWILIIIAFALVALSAAGVAFAALFDFNITKKYITRAATDSFTLSINGVDVDGGYYYNDQTLSTTREFTLKRNISSTAVVRIAAVDVVVKSSAAAELNANNVAVSGTEKAVDGGYATVFRNITYSENMPIKLTFAEACTAQTIVLPADDNNVYVSSIFELQLENDASLENIKVSETIAGDTPYKYRAYKNIYIVGDFSVSEDCMLNSPAMINFLSSTVTFESGSTLTVRHPYSGIYALEMLPSNTAPISGDGSLVIDAPRAFYTTGSVAAAAAGVTVTVIAAPDFTSDAVLTALVNDALTYADERLPRYVYRETELAYTYHNFPVTLTYSWADGITSAAALTPESNSKTQTLTITAASGNISATRTLTLTVVGTSAAARSAELLRIIQAAAQNSLVVQDGEELLDFPVALKSALSYYIRNLGENTFTLALTGDTSYLYFEVNGVRRRTLEVNGGNVTVGGVSTDLEQATVLLRREERVLDPATETLTVTLGGQSASATLSPKHVGNDEKMIYLNRFVENVFYFNNTSERAAVPFINNGTVSLGAVTDGDLPEVLVYSDLGFARIDYAVYVVNENADPSTVTDAELTTPLEGKFEVVDGVLRPLATLTIEEGKMLLLRVTFVPKDGGTAAELNFNRRIVIPSSGLGGDEYTDYIAGDTFRDFFEQLPDGKLINSSVTAGTATALRSPYSAQIQLNIYIDEAQAEQVKSFCRIVNVGDAYYIDIDIDNVPSVNTLIYLYADFYLETDDGNGDIIKRTVSLQPYNFIIPGIYRCGAGAEFADARLYEYLVGYGGATPAFESFQNFLLADGASAELQLLDLTGITATVANPLVLDGIEYLTGIKGIALDGVTVSSLSAFAKITAHIEYLSLKNCGITNAMLSNGNPIYALNRLNSLYLDENAGITAITAGSIYRTVQTLSVKDCQLTTLDGITALPALQVLYAENNYISRFAPLKKLSSLQSAYISGNTVGAPTGHEGAVLYGTDGEINYPIYVSLWLRGVKLYTQAGVDMPFDCTNDGDKLYAAQAMNAILLPDAVWNGAGVIVPASMGVNTSDSAVTVAVSVYRVIDCENFASIAFISSASGSTATAVFPEQPSGATALKIGVVLSITVGEFTVYGEFMCDYYWSAQ